MMLHEPKPGEAVSAAFELMQVARPQPQDGQILVENLLVDVAPYQRLVMERGYPGEPGHGPGMPMLAESIGRVIETRHPSFECGDIVVGRSLWQEHVLYNGDRLNFGDTHRHKIEKLANDRIPLSAHLGVLGINGYTAYSGLIFMAKPVAGDTIVVSAAGGSVGSIVGQIGKSAGCRVVGIVSTPDKAERVRQAYGFDACVAYKQEGWLNDLMAACPDGIDIFYDNVAGQLLRDVSERMNLNGRIVISGFAGDYGSGVSAGGPSSRIIGPRRLNIQGLVVWDHMHKRSAMHARLARWLVEGGIVNVEIIEDGLENAPLLLERVMSGQTFGKALIRLAS
jgi:NADPH-dependent curcumin reductase CurA